MAIGLNPIRTTGRSRTLASALAAGLATAALIYLFLSRQAAPPRAVSPPATVLTVVAARDIPARTLVTTALVKVRRVPAAQAADAARSPQDVIGRIAVEPIAAGHPLTREMVADRNVSLGLAYAVPPSYRAVTVALDPVGGVAGFIRPGDHVDVLSTFEVGGGQSVTRTVLQNVALLATGAQALPGAGAGPGRAAAAPSVATTAPPPPIPNATLMVSPQDAQILVLAATRGKLQLALRAADDSSQPEIPALHSTAITGYVPGARPADTTPPRRHRAVVSPRPRAPVVPPLPVLPVAPPVQARPGPPTITVIKGTETKIVTVSQ